MACRICRYVDKPIVRTCRSKSKNEKENKL